MHMSRLVFDNILGTIGDTPLVRLNRISSEIKATVYAKVETFNPGHSIKDRMAVKMIEDAEKAGLLKPGGTIIEGTSGNTGMGLAIAAIRSNSTNPDIKIIVGGHTFLEDPDLVDKVGADHLAKDALDAVQFADNCLLESALLE